MKKISVLLVAVLAISVLFCACGKPTLTTLNSASDFSQYSISLDAPEGASAKKYAVLEQTNNGEKFNIAQVTYTYSGVNCTLRTANLADYNVSGIDESKGTDEQSYDLNIGSYDSSIRIMKSGSQYVACWTLGKHSYSLVATTSDAVSFTTCAMDAANANVPLANG